MKPETAKFLRSRFREYYLEESLEAPPPSKKGVGLHPLR